MSERFSTPLEFKAVGVEAEAGVFTGYGSVFGNVDSYGDRVLQGAFVKSLAARTPVMLFAHRQDQPIGRWVECREDGTGLRVKGALNLDVARAREVHSLLKHGDVAGLSIGYGIPPGGRIAARDGLSANLAAVDLHEISVVSLPSNPLAKVDAVKSLRSRAEVEAILTRHLPGRMAKKLLSGGWAAVTGEDEPDDDPEIDALARSIDHAVRLLKGV